MWPPTRTPPSHLIGPSRWAPPRQDWAGETHTHTCTDIDTRTHMQSNTNAGLMLRLADKQARDLIGCPGRCVIYVHHWVSEPQVVDGKAVRCRGNTKHRAGPSYGAKDVRRLPTMVGNKHVTDWGRGQRVPEVRPGHCFQWNPIHLCLLFPPSHIGFSLL